MLVRVNTISQFQMFFKNSYFVCVGVWRMIFYTPDCSTVQYTPLSCITFCE